MATLKRRDTKGRVLLNGEHQNKTGSYKGRYEYTYTDHLGKVHHVYSWRLTAADPVPLGKKNCRPLRDLEQEIQEKLISGVIIRKKTVIQMWEEYQESRFDWKPTTKAHHVYAFDKHIRGSIGKAQIASIRYSDVEKLYISLIRENGLSVGTLKNVHTILNPLFTRARIDGLILYNPCPDALTAVLKRYNKVTGQKHGLTREEEKRFFAWLQESNVYAKYYELMIVLIGTGCRIGELAALTWKDINFEAETITIEKTLVYFKEESSGQFEMHIQSTKTAAGRRIVPMSEAVKAALISMKEKDRLKICEAVDGFQDFIFIGRREHLPYSPNYLWQLLTRMCNAYNREEGKRADQEGRPPVLINNFSPHTLRHTFVTRLYENGVDSRIMQELAGHTSDALTLGVYTDVSEDLKRRAVKTLDTIAT